MGRAKGNPSLHLPSLSPLMPFTLGSRVRVTDLASAQHHNGKAGTVCAAVDEGSGRCNVLLDDGSQLAIKPCKLASIDAPAAAQAPPSGSPSAAPAAAASPAGAASAAEVAGMSVVACLQALRSIDDAAARRARTVEVYELLTVQWRKSSQYRSTMARHLVEDVRARAFLQRMHATCVSASPAPPTPSGPPHVPFWIQDRAAQVTGCRCR